MPIKSKTRREGCENQEQIVLPANWSQADYQNKSYYLYLKVKEFGPSIIEIALNETPN